MSAVICHRHEGWADVVLNRPERRNAIEGTLAAALLETLRALNADDSVRAVVLSGAGGAFCSGLDLKAFSAEPAAAWKADFPARWDAVHTELIECRKVLVVALERFAINGGAALAIAADLLVAGESAFLQVGEVQIGMAAPKNVAWLALRHPEAVAARLCLLGERVGAAELLRLGIATEVVADADVLQRSQALAQRIAGYPADAVSRIKTSLRAASTRMPAREWFAACADADPLPRDWRAPPRPQP